MNVLAEIIGWLVIGIALGAAIGFAFGAICSGIGMVVFDILSAGGLRQSVRNIGIARMPYGMLVCFWRGALDAFSPYGIEYESERYRWTPPFKLERMPEPAQQAAQEGGEA